VRLKAFWKRKVMGRPGRISWSLPERHEASGHREAAEENFETERHHMSSSHRSGREGRGIYSPTPTSVAARAPRAWLSAIRCGIAVMGTHIPSG